MAKRGTRKADPAGVVERLERAAEAFDAEDFEGALAHAEGALQLSPEHPEALHFRAAAQVELGEVEDAARTYMRAVKAAPDAVELLLGAAECLVVGLGEDRDAVSEGLALCARGRKLAERADDVERVFEFLLLEATGFNQLGECEEALVKADAALAHVPRSVEAQLERAMALFELCRFEEARKAFERVLEDEPDEPWAHHSLGLLAERRGDAKEAQRRFQRAQALAPEEFPPPVHLGEAAFDQALEDAVKGLPEHVKGYLDNVTIAVEDLPSDEDLLAEKPPLSPAILGVFRGTPVGERSVMNAADHFPASIVLYQRNLERFARTREELIEQIGITVMHEVGHLIGLDEEDLWERGLD
ncbi:tetratricopeptide repeat protein [Aggregicoccus sp. 17bor-14]|uniref:metallopeptidase family protein n=1 Tax=Myxococcaceae TaxID=31 RepID=UPI00129CB768|nr:MULTISPECIES: metallopeptidase family protein [Myxococcaceae]MBF5045633.1 metallopeptidase family protein [Simulacricoccus sp. 17bor-14]MRI91370.1 tetratricopeptide repeat protein [Aggregicoccus sp. 17bor-14]